MVVTTLIGPAHGETQPIIGRRPYGAELDYEKTLEDHASREQIIQTPPDTEFYGRYVKTDLLGCGGMGEVYCGYDPRTNRPVAIKVMTTWLMLHKRARKRFAREAQVLGQLDHPHIVRLLQFGEKNGFPFMVMEWIDGQSLQAYFDEKGPLPLPELLPLIQDLAAALDYAHENGIVHRDIKPSNIVLKSDSGRLYPVLMDFGIAKPMATLTDLTGAGVIGTLGYISPEQIQGEKDIDGRADVYSLGVMAYQLLTGELPFIEAYPSALLMAHLHRLPPDPRDLIPDLPGHVASAIMRAMAKNPDERFATAGDFARALIGE